MNIVEIAKSKNNPLVSDVRKFCIQMITGEGHDEIIKKYRPNEEESLAKQRVALYTPITPSVLARTRKFYKKLSRVDSVTTEKFNDNDGNKKKYESAVIDTLINEVPLKDFLIEALEKQNSLDPNAWIIYERRTDGNTDESKFFPIIIPSDQIEYFDESRGYIEKLVVSRPVMAKVNGKEINGKEYIEYTPGLTIIYSPTAFEDGTNEEKIYIEEDYYHFVKRIDTQFNEVPALPCGCYRHDIEPVYVPWFYPAKHVLFDLIRRKSYFDVHLYKHVFAKKFEYDKPCKFKDSRGRVCRSGLLDEMTNEHCPSCGGTGRLRAVTEQQTISLAWPSNPNDVFDLTKLSHYEEIPIELATFLKEIVDDAEKRVHDAIFNSEVLDRPVVEKTATEINYEYEDKFDVLKAFAVNISRHYTLALRAIMSYHGVDGYEVTQRFANDFKIKDINTLTSELKLLKESGAGVDVIRKKRQEILQKMYSDNPVQLRFVMEKMRWSPFDGKSAEEITAILATRPATDKTKILYEYFDNIFNTIEKEVLGFTEMTDQRKKETIDKYVNLIKDEIQKENQ